MTSSELRTQSKSSAARHAIPESFALTSTARKCGTSSRMLRGWKWSNAGTAKTYSMTLYSGSTGAGDVRLTQMDIALMGNGRTVTMAEIWKEITGYEGLYQVSNLGNVRRIGHLETNKNGIQRMLKDKNLKPKVDGKGYVHVILFNQNKRKTIRIHRLVAEMFIPNPNNYPQVNHKDEDKQNNKVDNLEWCTNKYNSNYGNRCQNISKTIRLWWEKRKQP